MVVQSTLSNAQFGLVLVFFIYGLAFFTLGIALALENGRSPNLLESGLLQPLALFGLLHGVHEWFEVIIIQGLWLGMPFPQEFQGLRLGLLVVSFLPLVYCSFRMLFPHGKPWVPAFSVFALLGVTLGLMAWHSQTAAGDIAARSDDLARYLLAVPGAILVSLVLERKARQVRTGGRKLKKRFRWAALGFFCYGLTQILVPASGMFPASFLNAAGFQALTGIPIQIIRAGLAVLIMVNLIRVIQLLDQERAGQLHEAQRARLEALEQIQHELEKREVMRLELLRHTVIAQEEERARLARELHDETAQVLSAFSLNLATLRSLLSGRSESKEILERLANLTRQMSQGLYRLVNDLRPAQLDDLGLPAALKHLADLMRSRQGLEVSVEILGPRQRLDPLVETVIFRVAQEALTNVSRHAQTDRGCLRLALSPEEARLSIMDQGVGFNLGEELVPPHGWGLAGMRERVESVGGSFEIATVVGAGTRIEAVVPLKQKEVGSGQVDTAGAGR